MSPNELFRAAGLVLGMVLTIPTVIVLVQAIRFFSKMESAIEHNNKALEDFIEACGKRFDRLETRQEEDGKKVHTLWQHSRKRRETDSIDD